MKDLFPLLDQNGLLCIGGRLGNANLRDSEKHPHIITHALKIVRQINDLGRELTLSLLRTRYWINIARSVARKVCHN